MNGRTLIGADIMDREDVGVVERCGGAGFLLEALEALPSAENAAGRTLIATSRPSRESCAR